MTFNEAKQLALKSGAPLICIKCEQWVRGIEHEPTTFSLWDGKKTHDGPTLEVALGKFLAANPVLLPAEENSSVAEGFFAEVQPENVVPMEAAV